MPLSAIADVLDDLRAGKFIVLIDDEDRENEGDLVLPAQFATPESINFMLSVARGYLCLSMTEADCDRLHLTPQVPVNTSNRSTAFTVSIDGHPKHGFTTGVSARERARTIQMAIDPASRPDDFVRPGHINPLRARDGGTLVRVGQTEGSIDLCRMAGLTPAALIIEIMRDDGEMARLPDLIELAQKHNFRIASVRQIVEHRLARETLVRRVGPPHGVPVRTPFGDFTGLVFRSLVDTMPHLALCAGGVGELDAHDRVVRSDQPTLVRMHRATTLGDVFFDLDSAADEPTGATLHAALARITRAGRGAVIYLRPDVVDTPAGSGARSLESFIQGSARAADWAEKPGDFHPAGQGERPLTATETLLRARMLDYGVGGQILRALGLSRLLLISNNARPMPMLEAFGLEVCGTIPTFPRE